MSKAYQEIIIELIERICHKMRASETAKTILKAHFTQISSRRNLTLDSLGKLPELSREVTRERARQIISKFVNKDLPTELNRLNRGLAAGDPITLTEKKDLVQLKELIEVLIDKITNTKKPVFSNKVQSTLIKAGIIDNNVYLPIVVQLAKSFGINTDFKFHEYNGHQIILGKNHNSKCATSDLVTYAGKISTYFGGLFSIEKIVDSSWNPASPYFIDEIPSEIRAEYIYDLISTEHDFLSIAHGSFYTFASRDERISRILKPIFVHYKSPLKVERVVSALKRALTHNFRRNADARQNACLDLLEKSDDALDDYCLKTGLLQVSKPGYRTPGEYLYLESQPVELSDTINYQVIALNAIKSNGGPLDSMSMGKELKGKIPDAFKPFIFSYPTLYYKEGGGRRNDYYKPLDDIYIPSERIVRPIDTRMERIDSIKIKINDVIRELESMDVLGTVLTKTRAEQALLREYLLLQQSVFSGNENDVGICDICGSSWPHAILIAAHVKPRSKCTHEERADFDNIAMLQCAMCDSLFENGFIAIFSDGKVAINRDKKITKNLAQMYSTIESRTTPYANGNPNRMQYLHYHWINIFKGESCLFNIAP
ncbi:HNH endonuclease signature motif containing protein [Pantoea vagans]|uniref:HNH nuclease domain-containing protein n=1 Tax=Pantoea vagans TaxID=470934 RepID=A0AAN1NQY3_9GAMM|nr:HNH endonuclease signature motif containing protein [Pantoea vagans]AVV37592.1 hypothetical protein C9381_10485 [Pantoea vagans]